MSERFTLSWNDHAANLKQVFWNLLTDQHLTDVTLVCDDGTQINAHKIVLSSASLFFRKIMTKDLQTNNIYIYMKGVNHKNIIDIIKFLYLGETSVEQSDLKEFLELSKELKIQGLSEEVNANSDHIKKENDEETPEAEEDTLYSEKELNNENEHIEKETNPNEENIEDKENIFYSKTSHTL